MQITIVVQKTSTKAGISLYSNAVLVTTNYQGLQQEKPANQPLKSLQEISTLTSLLY